MAVEGQPIWIEALISDWDDGSLPDAACFGWVELAGRSLDEWASMQNVPFTIHGWGIDGGTCIVTGLITAIGP